MNESLKLILIFIPVRTIIFFMPKYLALYIQKLDSTVINLIQILILKSD